MTINPTCLILPCEDNQTWTNLGNHFQKFQSFQSLNDFASVFKGVYNSPFFTSNSYPDGLVDFLKYYIVPEEQNRFSQLIAFILGCAFELQNQMKDFHYFPPFISKIFFDISRNNKGQRLVDGRTLPLLTQSGYYMAVMNAPLNPRAPGLLKEVLSGQRIPYDDKAEKALIVMETKGISISRSISSCILAHLMFSSFDSNQFERLKMPNFDYATILRGEKLQKCDVPIIDKNIMSQFPNTSIFHQTSYPYTAKLSNHTFSVKMNLQPNCAEKFKCLLHYFSRLQSDKGRDHYSGRINVSRRALLFAPPWEDLTGVFPPNVSMPATVPSPFGPPFSQHTPMQKTLYFCDVVFTTKTIEEDDDDNGDDPADPYYRVDFANKNIGGGVVGHGCMEEEILFTIIPELLITRLVNQPLMDNEAVLVEGCERFSKYSGYSQKFRYAGDHHDINRAGDTFTSKYIIIDALQFRDSDKEEQFNEAQIRRELNKAVVGFSFVPPNGRLATGHWGCGASNGDDILKFIIQWMAASFCGVRYMRYSSSGHDEFLQYATEIVHMIKRGRNVYVQPKKRKEGGGGRGGEGGGAGSELYPQIQKFIAQFDRIFEEKAKAKMKDNQFQNIKITPYLKDRNPIGLDRMWQLLMEYSSDKPARGEKCPPKDGDTLCNFLKRFAD